MEPMTTQPKPLRPERAGQVYSRSMNVRLSDEQHDWLLEMAAEHGQPISAQLREIVENAIAWHRHSKSVPTPPPLPIRGRDNPPKR
jgi:plasmid stability protein